MATSTKERVLLRLFPPTAQPARRSPALRSVPRSWRRSTPTGGPASTLCLGMLYLKDNPLLRQPQAGAHEVPTAGPRARMPARPLRIFTSTVDHQVRIECHLYLGPGPRGAGGPVQAYLEGTYSRYTPDKTEDTAGLQRFFKQFSFPADRQHATPETPGSIHEGGELGYSISHAYGTVYDHPT